MIFSEEELIKKYRQIDLDPSFALQKSIYERISNKKKMFFSYSLAAACTFCCILGFCVCRLFLPISHTELYYPEAWINIQADFSEYLTPNGEFLVSK